MRFQRRRPLRTLSFAFGSSFILSRDQLGIAAQTATQPIPLLPLRGQSVRNGVAAAAENGRSDEHRRAILPSARSKSVGELVPAAPRGSRSHHRATRNPFGSKVQQQSLGRQGIPQISIRLGIWFGTKRWEVRSLSPRPIFSRLFSTLRGFGDVRLILSYRCIRYSWRQSEVEAAIFRPHL